MRNKIMVVMLMLLLPVSAMAEKQIIDLQDRTECSFVDWKQGEYCLTAVDINELDLSKDGKNLLKGLNNDNHQQYLSELSSNVTSFNVWIQDKEKLIIEGWIRQGTQNYWLMEFADFILDPYWNSSWNAYKNITWYNQTPATYEMEYVNFTLNTTGSNQLIDCDEVRLVNSTGDLITSEILDATNEASGVCVMAHLIDWTENVTISAYYNNSGVSAPVFDEVVIVTDDGTDWTINGTTYKSLKFEQNSGSYDDVYDTDGAIIGQYGDAGATNILVYQSGAGVVIGGADSDETCIIVENTTLHAIITCDTGEDSNDDGDCDAGETCVEWRFYPGYWEYDIQYTGGQTWFSGGITVDQKYAKIWHTEAGGDTSWEASGSVTAKTVTKGYVVANSSTTDRSIIGVWDINDFNDFAVDGDRGGSSDKSEVWTGRDAGVWGLSSGDQDLEYRQMLLYGTPSNNAGLNAELVFINDLLYEVSGETTYTPEAPPTPDTIEADIVVCFTTKDICVNIGDGTIYLPNDNNNVWLI